MKCNKSAAALGLLILVLGVRCTPNLDLTQGKTPIQPAPRLVWSDEFNYNGLPDSSRWDYDTGDGCPNLCGWGNNELQYYTAYRSQNARVENGYLIIEAHREAINSRQYSSARLASRHKGDWQYGRIAVRARLPHGRGVWAAIWMLPTNWIYGGWPDSGEIDILEHVGFEPDSIFGTVHTRAFNGMVGTQAVRGYLLPDAEKQFHEYAVDWDKEQMKFLVDGQVFHTFVNQHTDYKAWPFDQPFHLLLNLAVGGNWGAKKGIDDTVWPQRMEVDYVRVYQF